MFSSDEAISLVAQLLDPNSFTFLEEMVLRGSWEGKSYNQIAAEVNRDPDYLKQVGQKLWQLLSQLLGCKVTKLNLRASLQRYARCHATKQGLVPELEETLPTLALPNIVAAKTITNSLSNTLEEKLVSSQDWEEDIDISFFVGRESELNTLKQWTLYEQCRLVSVIGMGGIGKTSLVVKLTKSIQAHFDYFIWRSVRNAPPLSVLLSELLPFLSRQESSFPKETEEQVADLMSYLQQYRCLLVLDNIETLLDPGAPIGKYRSGYEDYGYLLRRVADEHHFSCILLASREPPIGLLSREGKSFPTRVLPLKGVQPAEGQAILQTKGINAPWLDIEKLVCQYAGHPLALKVMGSAITSLFEGNVAGFLNKGALVLGELQLLLDQHFERLSELEKQIMYELCVEGTKLSLGELQNSMPTLHHSQVQRALESLVQRSMIVTHSGRFTLTPMWVEYIKEQLSTASKFSSCA